MQLSCCSQNAGKSKELGKERGEITARGSRRACAVGDKVTLWWGGEREMELTSKANASDRQDTWQEMGSASAPSLREMHSWREGSELAADSL